MSKCFDHVQYCCGVLEKDRVWESFGLIYDTLRKVGKYGTDVEYQELKKQLQNVKMSLVAEIEEDKKLCVLSTIGLSICCGI